MTRSARRTRDGSAEHHRIPLVRGGFGFVRLHLRPLGNGADATRSRPVSVTRGRARFSSGGPDRSNTMTSAVRYELAALTAQLAQMCALAAEAMNHATHALLLAIKHADLQQFRVA
jgi:hypothetical protein